MVRILKGLAIVLAVNPFCISHASDSMPFFTDVTEISGVEYQHAAGEFVLKNGHNSRYMPETMGSGVVLFDYDNDGDADLFFNNASTFEENKSSDSHPSLYENMGNMRFRDVSDQAGFTEPIHGTGAVAADYDGNGYSDLLLTGFGGPWLFRNNEDGSFTDVSEDAGLSATTWRNRHGQTGFNWSTGAVFLDVDQDLDLDLFVINYVKWSPQADIFTTIDTVRKGYTSPRSYEGVIPELYIQENKKFERHFSLVSEDGIPLEGKSLGVTVWDFDNDNRLDIVVANDTERNYLFHNRGHGQFREVGLSSGIAFDTEGNARAGMGIDVADYLNNNSAGVAIGNFQSEPTSLFAMNANMEFHEVSEESGIARYTLPVLTFGLSFADLDLDGWQDLVMTNGHTEPLIQEVFGNVLYKQPMTVLINRKSGRFENVSQIAGGAISEPIVGRGLAVGDLDNDGDIDIVVTENGGLAKLIRNETTINNSINVRLIGDSPNTSAIGAKIELSVDDVVQRRIIRTGGSYLSQSDLVQTFGLEKSERIDRLLIQWPDGRKQTVPINKVNGTYTIYQGKYGDRYQFDSFLRAH